MITEKAVPGPRGLPVLVLIAGAAILLASYALLQNIGDRWQVPPPMEDSGMVYQYARAIAEGHPYEFNRGDGRTTGSTSHVYPALVAVLYRLGARGDGLPTAVFVLNGFLFLLLLAGVWSASKQLHPESAPLATGLVLFSGHLYFTFLSQNDMSLFAVTVIWTFRALLGGRWAVASLLLMLAAFNRPEGLLLAAALLVVALLPIGGGRAIDRRMIGAGLVGLAAFVAVLLLNRYLTGYFRFTSILGKGAPGQGSLVLMLSEISGSVGSLVAEIFFGLGGGARRLFLFPVVGGVLAVVGLISRPWTSGSTARAELWAMLSLAGLVLMVASSGWAGTQFDRYFMWALPLWLMYAAVGAFEVGRLLPGRHAFRLIAAGLILFQGLGLLYFGSAMVLTTATMASKREFIGTIAERLPAGSRIGAGGLSGLKYFLPDHTLINIFGNTSPDFIHTTPSPLVNVEKLRHSPELRFESWITVPAEDSREFFSVFLGETRAAQVPAYSERAALALRDADWSSIEGATAPLSAGVNRRIEGMTQVDALDVGYPPHEERGEYRVIESTPGAVFPLIMQTLEVGGRPVTDVGRVVLDAAAMRIKARPGEDMVMALRTCALADVPKSTGTTRFPFPSPLRLKVSVDGQPAGEFSVLLRGPEEFTEAAFLIPGSLIRGETIEVGIEGRHAAFAIWFYQ